ncbi:hypothetical protein, partial [Alicyclobacillus fodiniaquatilis]
RNIAVSTIICGFSSGFLREIPLCPCFRHLNAERLLNKKKSPFGKMEVSSNHVQRGDFFVY